MKKLLAGAILASIVAAIGPANAEPSPAPAEKVLRHLVYAAHVSSRQTTEYRGGKPIADPFGGNTVHGEVQSNADAEVVCDVMAANSLGDLVIDVTENSTERRSGRSRVAVHSDGSLQFITPGTVLNEEETLLLKFLARGVMSGRESLVGASWAFENLGDRYKSSTKFAVTAVRGASDVDLQVDEEYSLSGTSGFSGVRHGKLTYDPNMSVPRRLVVESVTRAQPSMSTYTTVTVMSEISLKEDSFAKRP